MKYIFPALILLTACSAQQHISRQAKRSLINDPVLATAHLGISLYDVAGQRYLYNYQGNRYFVPASNTKIITCYATMKHLGDSVPGMQYAIGDTAIYLLPTGDPTLLHPDYKRQPVIDWLKHADKPLYISDMNWKEEALGAGWSWDDYNEYYMPERSALPVYGNAVRWVQDSLTDGSAAVYSTPEVEWKVIFETDTARHQFYIQRNRAENIYHITQGKEKHREQLVPFATEGIRSAISLLSDTVGRPVMYYHGPALPKQGWKTIFSQPLDSLLRPMMRRSDNFFAEQSLLMVSNQLLGVMNDGQVVARLLRTDLSGLAQTPAWADGSGLSRFNLFTPRNFVTVLDSMQQQFGMERVKRIFPTGGQGTLSNYYKKDSGAIYAKTGSLTGVLALSGFLYTRKNKLMIFSILINNHHSSATVIRRKVEAFVEWVRDKY